MLKQVSVTESITGKRYEFSIDEDYEFVQLANEILKDNKMIKTTPDDETKMREYWDNSFGKKFFTEFTQKQQDELLRRNPNLNLSKVS